MHALQAKSMPLKNALLSDVCISTSAAPTYLPAHYFQTKEANGKAREYNLIDGGVAANNPVSSNRNPSDIQMCLGGGFLSLKGASPISSAVQFIRFYLEIRT